MQQHVSGHEQLGQVNVKMVREKPGEDRYTWCFKILE